MKVTKQKNIVKKKKSSTALTVLDRLGPIRFNATVKLSLYGRSGSGKTTLACDFPKPLMLIGTEDGTKSVHNISGIDYVRIKESPELGELVDHARESGKYKSVVLDTASNLQDMILREVLGLEELPPQKSWGMASRQQYGQCALQTKERLGQILNLADHYDINAIIIAQERNFNEDADTDSEDLLPSIGSALSPSVTGWLNPACDYIGHTFIRNRYGEKRIKLKGGKKETVQRVKLKGVEFCLRTGPNPIFTTKFRKPKGRELPDVLVDPTYEKILALIKGE